MSSLFLYWYFGYLHWTVKCIRWTGYYPGPSPIQQQQPGVVIVTQPGVTVIGGTSPFGELPIQIACPNCRNIVVTALSFEVGLMCWLFVGVLFIVGWVSVSAASNSIFQATVVWHVKYCNYLSHKYLDWLQLLCVIACRASVNTDVNKDLHAVLVNENLNFKFTSFDEPES